MNIEAIDIGRYPPDELNVIIEVPLGGEPIKYELDKRSGALVVDRFLYTPSATQAITASFRIHCAATATRSMRLS
jgi:inorganic pyrophosphatase